MPLQALVFDLDGTLVDTAPDLMAATNHTLGLAGRRAISEAQLRSFVGHGAGALIRRGLEATGGAVDDDAFKRLHLAFLDYYAANIVTHSRLFPGLLTLLDKARAAGLKLGVCTNKLEGLSAALLSGIRIAPYFGAVVGGDTLAVMKPDPAPYHETLRRLGVAARDSLMIGDSETDIRTAQAAGVPVIAVSFGYTPDHVSAYAPSHVIDHYDEAWAIVERYVQS